MTLQEDRLLPLDGLPAVQASPEVRFDRVTRLCQRLFGVPMAFVNLVGRDDVFLKSVQGFGDHPPTSVPRRETFCAHTVQEPGLLVVEDAAADPRFAGLPSVTGAPGIRFYAGAPLTAPGGQRVGALCIADVEAREFTPADREVLRDLATWVQKELNLTEELDRAAEVQRALLPTAPPADSRWEVAGACRPSREVGGDFFDWYPSHEGTLVAFGDVMGKGMPAAIVMASVRSALRVGARHVDLGQTLGEAARSVADDLDATSSFATVLLARLEVGGWVACADAGHGHLAVIRADGRIQVPVEGGLPLGIDAEESYAAHELRLGHGDLLLIHSDGLIELEGGPTSTEEVAALVRGAQGSQEAVDRLMALLDDATPSDDVTVVVARRR